MYSIDKNPRLPSVFDRTTVVGRTGSGKTHFGKWLLSKQDLKNFAWVILDFKRQDFNDLNVKRIKYDIPGFSGLHLVQPRIDEKTQLRDYLWKIWESQGIGIFIDEGYMIPELDAEQPFKAILTQGRSLQIPLITLTQRPSFISRFVFSEASFIVLFDLIDDRDYETVQSFMPDIAAQRLPDYHSWYFDVSRKSIAQFKPVPSQTEIESAINKQLFTRKI
jgi:hypothetical protein